MTGEMRIPMPMREQGLVARLVARFGEWRAARRAAAAAPRLAPGRTQNDEDWLAAACDHADLERRLRLLERGADPDDLSPP